MRISSANAIRLLAVAVFLTLLSGSACICDYHLINSIGQYGWTIARLYNSKCDFSPYAIVAKGSPGPSPSGCLYMQAERSGSGGIGNPGQVWFGTDLYSGVPLSSITKLSYWTIVDYRGQENNPLPDGQGNVVPNEYRVGFLASQPPSLQLSVKINSGADWRVLIYRPWSSTLPGFGPKDGSLARKWQHLDCLTQGVWLDSTDINQPMLTWQQILSAYPDATLTTPPIASPPRYRITAEAPTGCSLNIVLGARTSTNAGFPAGYVDWWQESWNAQCAVDNVSIAYIDTYNDLVSDEFDFQSPTYATDPTANQIRAMSIRAIVDQSPWVPPGRSRMGVPWGGYNTQANFFNANALQRAGNFNYEVSSSNGEIVSGSSRGHLFVIYGRVSGTSGNMFKLDDGSGFLIDCYCPNASQVPVTDGQFLRVLGTAYGQCPFEWYFNAFHQVTYDPPTYSSLWPWEFHTFAWNVQILQD